MKKMHISTSLLPREITWGTRYLLFSLFFLGPLLNLLLNWLWQGVPTGGLRNTVLDTIYYGVNLVACIFLFRHFLAESLRHMPKHLLRILLVSIVALVVYFAIAIALEYAVDIWKPDYFNRNNKYTYQKISYNQWVNIFGVIALVPVSEELLYRGLVFGAICKRSRILGYVVSILLFASIHVLPYWGTYTVSEIFISFFIYLPAGLILALSYEISDSIFAPILIHTIINSIALYI